MSTAFLKPVLELCLEDARQHLNVCMVDELCLLPHEVPERVLHSTPCLVEVPDADTGLTVVCLSSSGTDTMRTCTH